MNSTITPIMALNLMSCTEPVIPFENNNTTISTNANDTNLYENKNDFKTEYYGGFYRNSIIYNIYTSNNYKVVRNNVKIPKKFRQKRNNNKYNRKIRNIHQPGRTNCTQRLFK